MECQHIQSIMHWKTITNRTGKTLKNRKLNIKTNFDEVTGENTQEHNLRCPKIHFTFIICHVSSTEINLIITVEINTTLEQKKVKLKSNMQFCP